MREELKKPLNLKIKSQQIDEVTDTIYDVLRAGVLIEEILEDGFSLMDIIDAVKLQPIVNEIINDVPQFIDEIVAIDGDTVKQSVMYALRKLEDKTDVGKVTMTIVNILYALSSSYDFSRHVYNRARIQHSLWKSIIAGESIIPTE